MADTVSIIVPVYKVEERILRRCVESLLRQSYSDIEIILVDDGSPDNCGEICDEYALLDSRVKTLHQPNGGVSSARNTGLSVCKGEYITFVDSDDYVKSEYVERIHNALVSNNADCAMCNCHTFTNEDEIENASVEYACRVLNKDEIVNAICYMKQPYDGFEITSVWGVLYKREIIIDSRFNENIRIGEDFVFKYYAMNNINSAVLYNTKDYYYYIRPDSAMRNGFDAEKLKAIDEFEKILSVEYSSSYYNALMSRFVNIAIVILFTIPLGTEYKTYRKSVMKFIKKYRKNVLANKNTRLKVKGALYLSYIVGFGGVKRIFEIAK